MRHDLVPRIPDTIDDEYLRGELSTYHYMILHHRWLHQIIKRTTSVVLGLAHIGIKGESDLPVAAQEIADRAQVRLRPPSLLDQPGLDE